MMKNNIEKEDSYIQNLSLKDLKKISSTKKNTFFEMKKFENNFYDDKIINLDEAIQNSSINELKLLKKTMKNIEKYNMKYKAIKTGLSENRIILIETNKQKATLEELICYCKGLEISYKKFLPELF